MNRNQKTGKMGEDLAAAHLEEKGYTILDRNYRFMKGEIDLVCHKDLFIVFVEVKTRSTHLFGYPEEHIDRKQKNKLLEVADAWLHERKMEGAPVRFDVIAIVLEPDKEPELTHIKNALF